MNFSDLSFKPHPIGQWSRAKHFFDNGYGVVVMESYSIGKSLAPMRTYNLAVVKGSKDNWKYCGDTPITDKYLTCSTHDDITNILAQVENLI